MRLGFPSLSLANPPRPRPIVTPTPSPTPTFSTLTIGPGITGITLDEKAVVTSSGKLLLPLLAGVDEFGALNQYDVTLTGANAGFRARHCLEFRYPYNQPVDNHTIAVGLLLSDDSLMEDYVPHDGALGRTRVTTRGINSAWYSLKQPQTWGPPPGYNALAYSKLWKSQGVVFRVFRASNTTSGIRPTFIMWATESSIIAGSPSWSYQKIINNIGTPTQRPYSVGYYDAANDRYVMAASQGHVEEDFTVISGFYLKWVSGSLKAYRYDDVDVTSTMLTDGLDPTNSAHMTPIDDTTGGRCWPYDIGLDVDGKICVCYEKVINVGNVQNTANKVRHARHLGGTSFALTDVETGQYSYPSGQNGVWYPSNIAQACLDGIDGSIVIAGDTSGMSGSPTVAASVMKKFLVDKVTNAVSLLATLDFSGLNHGPYSPPNHQGLVDGIWSNGPFPAYNAFTTVEKARLPFSAFVIPSTGTVPAHTDWLSRLTDGASMTSNNKDITKWGIYMLQQLGVWATTDVLWLSAFVASLADLHVNAPGVAFGGLNVGTGPGFGLGRGIVGTGSGSGNYMAINGGTPAALTNYSRDSNAVILHSKGIKGSDPTANLLGPTASPTQDLIQFVNGGSVGYRSSNTAPTGGVTSAGNGAMPASTGYDGYLDGLTGYTRTDAAGFSVFQSNRKVLSATGTSASQATVALAVLRDMPSTVSMGLLWMAAGVAVDLYAEINDVFDTMLINAG